MDSREKQYLEEFKTYLSVEKNFSEHTIFAYTSDLTSYLLWLNSTSCLNVDFNKLRESVTSDGREKVKEENKAYVAENVSQSLPIDEDDLPF